mgnify:CR=1 FL=1
MRKQLLCITITLLLALAATAFIVEKRSVIANSELNSSPRGSLGAKTTPLEDWVDRLGRLEGCSTLGTPDKGSLSFNRWCFKEPTWVWMFREYNEATNAYPYIEEREYMNLIGDNELARKVVIWNIAKEPNRDLHWSPVKNQLIERAPRI